MKVIDVIINPVKERLNKRAYLKKILLNIGWLFFDKVFRIGLNFLIVTWIAKKLGADLFGIWNYVIAFVSLFSILSTLGLDNIVVKELVKEEFDKNEILGGSFFLKLTGAILGVILSLFSISFIRDDAQISFLVFVISFGFVFQSFDVIDFYFQSLLKSKYTVYARNAAFLISGIIKISILYFSPTLNYFVLANLFEFALIAAFLSIAYFSNGYSIFKWKINWLVIKNLLKSSFPLIFAGMVILIYMRTDQIMLGNLVGDKEVGVFSAAVRISEAWYFIPLVITNSILPAIIDAKKKSNNEYLSKVQKSFDVMALLGIGTAVLVTIFSDFIITILYGHEYQGAGVILAIHTWTSIFVFLGFASGNWFIVENLQKYVLYRTTVGALINVGLNYLLIPKYGGLGAAVATLITQFVASYFFNLFNSKTYPVFRMQSVALWRVVSLYSLINFVKK